jgi:hypothetical protein
MGKWNILETTGLHTGNARDKKAFDTLFARKKHFLVSTTKDERVAALEAYNQASFKRFLFDEL